MVIICDEDRLLTWLFSSKEQQIPLSKTHKALRAALLELLLAVVLLLLLLPEFERVQSICCGEKKSICFGCDVHSEKFRVTFTALQSILFASNLSLKRFKSDAKFFRASHFNLEVFNRSTFLSYEVVIFP